MKKKLFTTIYDNIKTLLGALLIAILIRSLLFQPFYIPSSSMEPTLLVGDRIFVSKYTYGYSKHSFPFSPNFSSNRFFSQIPKRGDLVVFKTPADNRTDYIKRLIGLPGDTIQFVNGNFLINGKKILREKVEPSKIIRCGKFKLETNTFIETLPNGVKYLAVYKKKGTLQNTKKFMVPSKHFFLLGDNRDCSKDSRYLDSVGYVNNINNEKLEFLGDRVLGLTISERLLEKYPDEKEGVIDKKFANLVNKKTCSLIAKKINLKKFILLGSSHKKLERSSDKITSDCLEAIVGAIYLDGGLKSAEKFIYFFWEEYLLKSNVTLIDPKTKLQEFSLKKFKVLPKYIFFNNTGPQHRPLFKTEVQIPNSKKVIGIGSSKKKAQQNAANKLLKLLNV